MRLGRILSGILTAATLAASASSARSATQPPDIFGIKLGMTIVDAEAALKQLEPKIQIVPLYATDDPELIDGWNAPGGQYTTAAISDSPSTPAWQTSTFKVQIGILGVAVHHAFDDKENVVTDESAPIADLEGDFFQLRFTPNDSGGKLYSVARYAGYSANLTIPGSSSDALPVQTITDIISEKYGRPSFNSRSTGSLWLYDLRGRQLSSSTNEFNRCQVASAYRGGIAYQRTTSIQKSVNGMFQDDATESNLHTINLALSNTDGASLPSDDQRNAAAMLGALESIVAFDQGATDPGHYRKCGAELQIFVKASGDDRTLGFGEELSDLDALYFDNGTGKYIRQKFFPSTGSGPTAAAPKL